MPPYTAVRDTTAARDTTAPDNPVPDDTVPPPGQLAMLDDTVLVGRVGTGCVASFAVLVDRHTPALYRVAVRMLGDGHEAEDVVQDCFARVWQHAARWKPSGAGLIGWLHRVTLNLCFDRKRRFRVMITPDVPDVIDETPLADTLIESEQAHGQIVMALAALPDRYRAALVLCYLEGFTNAEAADMLNLHIKAMESLLFRARRQMRAVFDATGVAWSDLAPVQLTERAQIAALSAWR